MKREKSPKSLKLNFVCLSVLCLILSTSQVSYGVDITPPTGSVLINNGDASTTSPRVKLKINATDDSGPVDKMCISNTPSCTSWKGYATSKDWVLTPGSGERTVYVWFVDKAGNVSPTPTPYFDSIMLDSPGPKPNPMTWATPPYQTGTTSISMVATTATADTAVNYEFHFVNSPTGGSGGSNSAWQPGSSYTDAGLQANHQYGYQVKAKDGANHETEYSTPTAYAYTAIESPTGVTFGTVTTTSIQVQSSGTLSGLARGSSGLLIENATNNTDSGWKQNYNSWTSGSLSPGTSYTFQAKTRNGDAVESASSPPASKSTLANLPAPSSFSNIKQTCIRANWTTNGNGTGTQYYVENTTAGTNSGWTTDTFWDSCGLSCASTYQFRIKAKNGDGVETALTSLGSQSTGPCAQPFPFSDDFTTDKGWTGYQSGAWERGPAKAGGGENGYPDPGTDHSASSDNYILGFAIGGDYPNGLAETSVTSPFIDCTGQNQVYLKFWRYLNVQGSGSDHARIYVSNDAGATWTQVWENPVLDITDNGWTRVVLDISPVAHDQGTVSIRFTMGPTDASKPFSGWNIDDLEIAPQTVLYVPSGNLPNPNIDEMLVDAGFAIQHSSEIPADLGGYPLLIVSNEAACTPQTANYVKNFVESGGGAIVMGSAPRGFAGGTDLLTISDWFGALTYGNGCGYAAAADYAIGTNLTVNDKVDYWDDCSAPSVSDLDAYATPTSTWSSPDGTHSFIRPFGQGKVFYYAGDPGYVDPDPQLPQDLIKNGLTLFQAGLFWASNLLPIISVSPAAQDFGKVTVGATSGKQTFKVSNEGSYAIALGTLSITGADASQFAMKDDLCSGQALDPSSSCTVGVVFSPKSSGLKTASLSIPSNDPDNSTFDVAISGTGVAPKIGVKQGETLTIPAGGFFGFAEVPVGAGKVVEFTIESLGTADLILSGTPKVQIGGTNAQEFVVSSDASSPVAAGSATTFMIWFVPAGEGLRSGTVAIPSNDPEVSSFSFAIAGTGTAGIPSVTVTAQDAAAAEPPASDPGTFRISRTGSTTSSLTVYFTLAGTALNGTDYQTVTSPVTIPARAAYVDVPVAPLTDTVCESPETVILILSSSSAYKIGSAWNATVTIQDNQLNCLSIPTVSVVAIDDTAAEPPASDTGTFRISRTGSTASGLSVRIYFGGSAYSGMDFQSIPSLVTIPAGATYVDVPVIPLADGLCEYDERVILYLYPNKLVYSIDPNANGATVTIHDNVLDCR